MISLLVERAPDLRADPTEPLELVRAAAKVAAPRREHEPRVSAEPARRIRRGRDRPRNSHAGTPDRRGDARTADFHDLSHLGPAVVAAVADAVAYVNAVRARLVDWNAASGGANHTFETEACIDVDPRFGVRIAYAGVVRLNIGAFAEARDRADAGAEVLPPAAIQVAVGQDVLPSPRAC